MNNNSKIGQCPFSRKSYLIQKSSLSLGSQLIRKEKTQDYPSFADYVNSLQDINMANSVQKTPRIKMNENNLGRNKTLPKLDPLVPELKQMQSHFVLSTGKQYPLHTQQIKHQDSITEKRKPYLTPRLSTITKYSSKKLEPKSDDDMSQFYNKIGGEVTLFQIVKEFHSMTKSHPLIARMDDEEMYRYNFKNFLEYIMGKPVFYNLDTLRQKHVPLNIKNKEFNLFKSYMMNCFIKHNKGQPELVFEFGALIEQYRYCIIVREKTFAQIYNMKVENKKSKDIPETIYLLAHSAYSKIFQDTTLSAYFQGISIDSQAKKLGKIVHQMMGWDMSSDGVIKYLRDSHKNMHLTNVHFTLFKQYMIESMREIGITDKQIELVTSRMDGYRSCIINQDSLLDFYRQSPTLQTTQIKKYEMLLRKDPRLKNFPGIHTLERHSHFIMRYITHQHQPNPNRTDLAMLHQRCPIQGEWLDAFRENFFHLIRNLNLFNLTLQDYSDIWFQLRYSVINQQTIEKQIGQDVVEQIQFKLQVNLQENENYSYYFRNANYQIKFHIKRIMAFIFKNLQIYKANDLRVIHQALNINENTFNIFVFLIKHVMLEEGCSQKIIREAEQICLYYKNSICNL